MSEIEHLPKEVSNNANKKNKKSSLDKKHRESVLDCHDTSKKKFVPLDVLVLEIAQKALIKFNDKLTINNTKVALDLETWIESSIFEQAIPYLTASDLEEFYKKRDK